MSILNIAGSTLTGVAGVISKKRKKRRKRRKAKQKRQEARDQARNQLNAGFNTSPQSTADALDGVGSTRTDNQASASMSNPVMLALVGFLAYKFLLKK